MDGPAIDVQHDVAWPSVLVAMASGAARDAVVAVVSGLGTETVATEARGRTLLDAVAERCPDLVVVELSRLGEAGLRGLSRTAQGSPVMAAVLLLPGGLGGPDATVLGITAVLEESDLVGLRAVAQTITPRRCLERQPR